MHDNKVAHLLIRSWICSGGVYCLGLEMMVVVSARVVFTV